MWKSTHEAVRRENIMLRNVLVEAQKELRKHQSLLAGIKSGTIDIVATLDRMATKNK